MEDFLKIFEFAASLGAFEGYVYGKQKAEELNLAALENWSDNIEKAYGHIPPEVRRVFQDPCHQAAGRAIRSLEPVLGKGHPITQRLYNLLAHNEPLPESADAFNKKKWFYHES
jgi:hypothetical protein